MNGMPIGGKTMKISRLLGLALVVMLLFGTIAAGTLKAGAQSGTTPQAQLQGCDVEDDDTAEVPDSEGPDTDDVQCGQQDGPEDKDADADSVDEQSPSYIGSLAADDASYEGMNEADEAAALAGIAKISEEKAKDAASSAYPNATVVKVELDNENGVVVYSVELSDGSDVKVDAGNAEVLHTEAAGQAED
jgi:uncharacterized membrane protein YkoI